MAHLKVLISQLAFQKDGYIRNGILIFLYTQLELGGNSWSQ